MNITENRYSDYKSSGVEWLGEVPAHWQVRKIKQCAERFYAGGTPDSNEASFYAASDDGIPWLMISDMTAQQEVVKTAKNITEAGRASKGLDVLPVGTLLYSMYASLGTVSILGVPACVNQAILGIRFLPDLVDAKFGFYFLTNLRYSVTLLASSSTQLNLNAGKVKSLPIAVPPFAEQRAITRYLDAADARMRRYVQAKRKLLELLAEQKRAVIHRAVTRGLEADVRLKDSGVEWLGEVPAHWEILPLRSIATVRKGRLPQHIGEANAKENAMPYLTMRFLRSGGNEAAEFATPTHDSVIANDGDVILLWDGANAGEFFRAKAGIVSSTSALITLRGVFDDYFYYASVLLEPVLRAFTVGMGVPHIDGDVLKRLRLAIPPLTEQTVIAAHLDRQTANIDALIAVTRRQMELAEEYRARLIADAVTGKVDVGE